MIHLFQLYENFNSMYGTSQTGFFRPLSDFVPSLKETSLDIFNRLCGVEPRSQKIIDWLIPFSKGLNMTVVKGKTYDYIPYPKDYEYFDSASIIIENDRYCACPGMDILKEDTCLPADIAADFYPKRAQFTKSPVKKISKNKWNAFLTHPSLKPTLKKPGMTQQDVGFEVSPEGVGVIVLNYYRKPKDPVFNYSTNNTYPDEYIIFNEAGSVHLEWSDVLTPVFLYLLGKRYGLTVKNELILQVRQLDKIFE